MCVPSELHRGSRESGTNETGKTANFPQPIRGNPSYLYALLDDETSHSIAREDGGDKFSMKRPSIQVTCSDRASKLRARPVTDGLCARHQAFTRVLSPPQTA